MGKYIISRMSPDGKVECFFYNSIIAALEAKGRWEADYYICNLYIRADDIL